MVYVFVACCFLLSAGLTLHCSRIFYTDLCPYAYKHSLDPWDIVPSTVREVICTEDDDLAKKKSAPPLKRNEVKKVEVKREVVKQQQQQQSKPKPPPKSKPRTSPPPMSERQQMKMLEEMWKKEEAEKATKEQSARRENCEAEAGPAPPSPEPNITPVVATSPAVKAAALAYSSFIGDAPAPCAFIASPTSSSSLTSTSTSITASSEIFSDAMPISSSSSSKAKAKPASKKSKSDTWEEVEAPELPTCPCCPACGSTLMPQALLFDEDYTSHAFYDFEVFSKWFKEATIFIFVGTSFAVTVTDMALKEAKKREDVDIFNFNLEEGRLDSKKGMNIENVIGKSEVTLPLLVNALRDVLADRKHMLAEEMKEANAGATGIT